MIEILQFIFTSHWTYFATIGLLLVLCAIVEQIIQGLRKS